MTKLPVIGIKEVNSSRRYLLGALENYIVPEMREHEAATYGQRWAVSVAKTTDVIHTTDTSLG